MFLHFKKLSSKEFLVLTAWLRCIAKPKNVFTLTLLPVFSSTLLQPCSGAVFKPFVAGECVQAVCVIH